MPLSLIIAILELIIKLPEIIQTIVDIIARIRGRSLHLQGPLVTRLEALVSQAHSAHFLGTGDPHQPLKDFAAELGAH